MSDYREDTGSLAEQASRKKANAAGEAAKEVGYKTSAAGLGALAKKLAKPTSTPRPTPRPVSGKR